MPQKINAGSLDRRISVLQKSVVQDDAGQEVETWTAVRTLWAGKRDAFASERFAAGQIVSEITTVFTLRWLRSFQLRPDLHRIVCDGHEYNVLGVTEIGRRQGVKVQASARAEDSLSRN